MPFAKGIPTPLSKTFWSVYGDWGRSLLFIRLPPGGSWRNAPEGERATMRIALIIGERKRERVAGSFHHFVVPLPLGGRQGRFSPTMRLRTNLFLLKSFSGRWGAFAKAPQHRAPVSLPRRRSWESRGYGSRRSKPYAGQSRCRSRTRGGRTCSPSGGTLPRPRGQRQAP